MSASPFAATFIAVDWGTTNRRIFVLEGGRVTASESGPRGVTAIGPDGFAAEVAAIRARLGDLPMLLAGMVGSTLGWRTAPYVPAPAGVDEVAAALLLLDDRTAIVPGVRTDADVMRGEEVQALGAAASGLAPPDALLCHPGTHCKWVRLAGGRIDGVVSAMTGELFALLKTHSVLAPQLGGEVKPGPAFREGVAEGARRDLAASLFGVRAASLLRTRDNGDAAAFASGVLIGSDVAARLAESEAETIHILADPPLAALYAAAITAHGRRPVVFDAETAFVEGMTAIGART